MFFFHPMWGFGWWWRPFHGLFSAFFIVIFVLALASFARPYPRRRAGYGRSGALQVLEERYARGEIQREEYLQKKTDLGG